MDLTGVFVRALDKLNPKLANYSIVSNNLHDVDRAITRKKHSKKRGNETSCCYFRSTTDWKDCTSEAVVFHSQLCQPGPS